MKFFRSHIIQALSDAIVFEQEVEKKRHYTSDSAYLATIKDYLKYLIDEKPSVIWFKD